MHGFFQRLHRALRPSRPRHPLLRVTLALIGLGLVLLLILPGLLIGLGMLGWQLARRQLRPAAKPQSRVLDSEYRVIHPTPISERR